MSQLFISGGQNILAKVYFLLPNMRAKKIQPDLILTLNSLHFFIFTFLFPSFSIFTAITLWFLFLDIVNGWILITCLEQWGWWQVRMRSAAAAATSLQSCLTLCDPIDGSPPGSPVPGILQARILEWVAIAFSSAWKWKGKVKSFSRLQLFATHGLQPTRLLRPWDFPGKSTGVGCHHFLRRMRSTEPEILSSEIFPLSPGIHFKTVSFYIVSRNC